MRRTALILALALIVSTIPAVPLTGAATGTGVQTTDDTQATSPAFADQNPPENDTANDSANVTPGGQFMGVIGVQQSELNGTIAEKSFGLKMAQAKSNSSKVAVVAEEVAELQRELEELRTRREQLREAHRNGNISTARYRAEMAELATEVRNVERLANATENESAGLPADRLAEKGINVTAIQTLKTSASNLTGPEVAAIARSIAGPDFGRDVANDRRPDDRGESGERGESGDHGKSGERGESGERGKSGDHGKSGNQRGANETTTTTGNETTTSGEETTTSGEETTTPEDGTGGNETTGNETTTATDSGRNGSDD